MLPPVEFSTGSSPCETRPEATAANTSSKWSNGTVSTPGHARCAAASLYAPGAPWNAIRIAYPVRRQNRKGAREDHKVMCSPILPAPFSRSCLAPLVFRLLRIHLIDPRENPTLEILRALDAALAQQLHGLGAAAAHLAMHDDPPPFGRGFDLLDPRADLAARDQHRAGNAADLVLLRLAHVEDVRPAAGVDGALQVEHGRLEGRGGRRRLRGGRRDAAELVVVDQLADGRIVAAHRALRVAPQLELAEAHPPGVVQQQPV